MVHQIARVQKEKLLFRGFFPNNMEAHTVGVDPTSSEVLLRFEAGWLKLEAIHLLMKSTSMSHVIKHMALMEDTLMTNNHGGLKEVAKKTTGGFLVFLDDEQSIKCPWLLFICWLSLQVSFFFSQTHQGLHLQLVDFWDSGWRRFPRKCLWNNHLLSGGVVDKAPSNCPGCPLAFTAPGSIRKTSLAISKPTSLHKVVDSFISHSPGTKKHWKKWLKPREEVQKQEKILAKVEKISWLVSSKRLFANCCLCRW